VDKAECEKCKSRLELQSFLMQADEASFHKSPRSMGVHFFQLALMPKCCFLQNYFVENPRSFAKFKLKSGHWVSVKGAYM